MPGGIYIKMTDIDEVLKKLDVQKLERDITDELAVFGANVMRDAQNNLSLNGTTDFGFLANSIHFVSKRLAVEIIANKDYAAYVEFGTGQFAAIQVQSLSPEWQAYARTFYVNGKGRMRAQPYLHPAFEKNLPELLKRLKALLNA